jgi:hypothetical protein
VAEQIPNSSFVVLDVLVAVERLQTDPAKLALCGRHRALL